MKNLYTLSWIFSFILIFGTIDTCLAQTYTWTGNKDTKWSDSANWSGGSGTPSSNSTVIIPNRTNDPIISNTDDITISELIVQTDGILTIKPLGVLNIIKSVGGTTSTCVTNEGTIVNEGGLYLTENSVATGPALKNDGTFQNQGAGNFAVTGDLNISDVSGVALNNSGTFSNSSFSEIIISNSVYYSIDCNSGSFVNYGNISLIEAGLYALRVKNVAATFTNEANGVLDITESPTAIAILEGGTINNNGTIFIDDITEYGIFTTDGTPSFPKFNNNSTGVININQRYNTTCKAGLILHYCTFKNTGGRINIDGTNSDPGFSRGIQLTNSSTFTNEEGGIINLASITNNIGTSAISVFDAIFVNTSCSGIINHSTEDELRVNDYDLGTFTNSGWIQSYCNTENHISNNYGAIVNYGSGTFTYDGGFNNPLIVPTSNEFTHVWIGEGDANWTTLCNWAADELPDTSSGVWVERELFNPILTSNKQIKALHISDENTSKLTINSGATLTVSGSSDVGVKVEGDFVNNGILDIDNTAGAGLHLANSLALGGVTYIGKTGNVGGNGIITNVGAVLDINACAEIYTYRPLTLNGNINNEGLLFILTDESHSGTVINDGVVDFALANSGLTIVNNDLVIDPFELEVCAASDVLNFGGSNDFTPSTTWYRNEAKTNAIGNYDIMTNSLDLTSSPIQGTENVYFTVSGNGCNFDVQTHYINEVPANNTITWEGSIDNDWTNACNWVPAIVPTGAENIVIPSTTNDPIIYNGVMALAKSVTIQSLAQLTIKNGGRITVSDSDGDGIYNQGTIDCEFNTLMLINEASGNGVYNTNGGIINNRGTLSVLEPDGHGLVNDNATFNNNANGSINLSMSDAPSGKNGIHQISGNLSNNTNTFIFPNVPNGNGLNIISGNLTNEGYIIGVGNVIIGASATLIPIVKGQSSSQYGQIVLNSSGSVILDGSISPVITYTPSHGHRIPFINTANSVSGTFATEVLPAFWQMDYSGTTDVAIKYCTNVYYADTDNDGYGDASVSTTGCTAPTGYVSDNTDCDDNDSYEFPGQTWYKDQDLDGYTDGITITDCERPTGYFAAAELMSTVELDCKDDDILVNPNPDCSSTTRTWTGHINNDWDEACNWSPNCVPTAADDVTIPVTANGPIVTNLTSAVANTIFVELGATLETIIEGTMDIGN